MLEESINRSLRRLRTDYVDLLQLHSCSKDILRRNDIIDVLVRARERGKTRYIGYSGDRSDALYAVQTGMFHVLQTSVNIADQEAIELLIPEAQRRNMGVIAKKPVANAVWLNQQVPMQETHTYWSRLQVLNYPFLLKSPQQSIATAMRFTMSVPGVHTLIVGTKNPNRCHQNAGIIAEGHLSKAEYACIRICWKQKADVEWVGQT